jgi:citrate lyase subunit beta/citryl-CoA lyase
MIRSLLYVPAIAERFIARAHERGADAIILDLEDSVPAARKIEARERLRTAVAEVRRNGAKVLARINGGIEDLMLADAEAACRAGVDALWVPKVRNEKELDRLAGALERVERACARTRPLKFVAAIETAEGLFSALAIARSAGGRVVGLNAGGEDLALALDAEPLPDVLRVPKLLVHYAAKAAGILSFGLLRSVASFRDIAGLREAAEEARRHGFDGATCIHPDSVSILNAAFTPPEAVLAEAARIVAAAEQAELEGSGAFEMDGRMIDAPAIARMRRLLAGARHGELP